MLTEVQKKLESAFPRRKHMFPVTTTLEIRQELKAATVSAFFASSFCLLRPIQNFFDKNMLFIIHVLDVISTNRPRRHP